MATKAAAI
jgi:hypothetical protein